MTSDVRTLFECDSAVELIRWCYALEFNENLHDSTVGLSWDDKCALDIQHHSACYLGDRYEVGLLLSCDDVTLPKYQRYINEMVYCGQAVVDNKMRHKSLREWFLIHYSMSGKFHIVMNRAHSTNTTH